MKTIAIVTSEFPAVSETFVVDHAVGMVRRGWNAVVVCLRADRERLAPVLGAVPELRVEELRPVRLSSRAGARALLDLAAVALSCPSAVRSRLGRDALLVAPALARAFRNIRADVVHAHFGPLGVASHMALCGRTPLVVDFHGYDFNVIPAGSGWDVYRACLRTSQIVVHSEFAAQRVKFGIRMPVHRVPLGVDLSLFSAPQRAAAWRSPLRLLVVGRLVAAKGQRDAIRALANLRSGASPLDARLKLVGDGPDRDPLEALAREKGLADLVEFAGAHTHARVAEDMASADVLLVPSMVGRDGAEEAFGRVVIEALATGLPVIASDIGGLPETVGDAGTLVRAEDPDALENAIRRLVANETPAACAVRSTARAAMFSIQRMWDEYDDVARAACR